MNDNMYMLAGAYIIGSVIGAAIFIWLNTKSGKKWKENL